MGTSELLESMMHGAFAVASARGKAQLVRTVRACVRACVLRALVLRVKTSKEREETARMRQQECKLNSPCA